MDTKRKSSYVDWLPITAILLTVIGVSALFLTPSFEEFPMDDTYIHLVYAENLAETGKLYFSFPDEVGVGATSILWVLLLAAGHAIGISTYFLAKFLGISSLMIVAVGLFVLLRDRIGRPLAFFAVFLSVVVGNLAWFSLSGMETMLFLALGILYSHRLSKKSMGLGWDLPWAAHPDSSGRFTPRLQHFYYRTPPKATIESNAHPDDEHHRLDRGAMVYLSLPSDRPHRSHKRGWKTSGP